jgi:DNA-binding response OmpR family regulator
MYRVAVVEDEELIRTMLRFNLERQGYDVECFGDAPQFLARLRPGLFDIILLDIMLPTLSGRQLITQVRGMADNTPIIMVTAVAEVTTVVDSLGAGADDYVTKPFNMEELLARVRAGIRRGRGERDSLPT